jgi:hypothetical protein
MLKGGMTGMFETTLNIKEAVMIQWLMGKGANVSCCLVVSHRTMRSIAGGCMILGKDDKLMNELPGWLSLLEQCSCSFTGCKYIASRGADI